MVSVDTNSFSDPAFEFFRDALALIDVDADALTEDDLHGSRMTQLDYRLEDQVDTLVIRGHSIQVNRIVNR